MGVDWETWRDKYEWIAGLLDLDPEMDRRAARILDELIVSIEFSGLKRLVEGEECIVLGAGPSLEFDLDGLSRTGWLDKVLIAADGATSAAIKYEPPEAIVTDLDGNVEDQLRAWRGGSWMVVHAHGDNIEEVRQTVPLLDERTVGTIQVEGPSRLHNFGGFTDGDRAAFLAHELGASKIYLAGMDLGEEVGKYSGRTQRGRKLIKLEICRELISWLVEEFGADVVNITAGGEDIPHVPREEIPSS